MYPPIAGTGLLSLHAAGLLKENALVESLVKPFRKEEFPFDPGQNVKKRPAKIRKV